MATLAGSLVTADFVASGSHAPPAHLGSDVPSGSGSVKSYFMRAMDAGRSAGANYSVWIATGVPDFAGAGYATSTPTPSGAIVAGSVVVVGTL